MSGSPGDVAEDVAAACETATEALAALEVAEDLAEAAHHLLASTLEGDTTGDRDRVLATFTEVRDGAKNLWKALVAGLKHAKAVREAVRDVERGVGRGAPSTCPPSSPTRHSVDRPRTPSPPASPQPASPQPTSPQPGPPSLSPTRVEELRSELPPTVVGSTGQKTHGRWITPDGSVRQIVSGNGPDATAVADYLQALPLPQPGVPMAASHVETKLASHMRETGIRHASVVINNRPCAGRFGCEILVGVILPEGSTLTVYGSGGYERTIQGGLRPPWQR